MTQDLNTLICLFHHRGQAQAALEEILKAGIPESNTSILGLDGSSIEASRSSLAELNVPERDIQHLLDGLTAGGAVLSVQALSEHADKVESIFAAHASKIDEVDVNDDMSAAALPVAAAVLPVAAATGATAIPIVEEELNVGKRTVDAGGVRVYRRIVDIPVQEQVTLREEHAFVDRKAVDRPVTDADLLSQGDRVIELTETAEQVVTAKEARVIEEVRVGKQATDHVETVSDTVRHTEVEVEEIDPVLTSDRTLTADRKL